MCESEERGEGEEVMMAEVAPASRISLPLYLLESSRTSGQGTLVKCCPPTEPFPGVSLPGETGDWSPARGLRQEGELPYEDHPLLGLVRPDSCWSKDPRTLPLKPRDLRLLSAQERRSPLELLRAGLGGLSARLEEKDLRRVWDVVWDTGSQDADGEEDLELCNGAEEVEEMGKVAFSSVGEPREEEKEREGEEEASRGFLG